jgi:hypothetical protein
MFVYVHKIWSCQKIRGFEKKVFVCSILLFSMLRDIFVPF